MAQLVLKSLTKIFQGKPAVSDLWLDVAAGEILSLLGPSGCGKSTTLQMIAGVLRPDHGTMELNGRLLNPVPPEKRNLALVLQKGLLFPHLTVGENVAFGLKMRGVGRAEREQKVIALLKQVQLDGFGDRKPAELSGGQAQRVALARALVIQPKLLLLDEPLSALDANLRGEMQALIRQLQRETGVTLMIVTHDQAEAVVMSHRIALMFNGQLRQVDPPEAFYQRPYDETTARFFGGVNFFSAQAHDRQLTLATETVLFTQHTHQGEVQVTIRPEQIDVLVDSPPGVNILPATVVANRFTGAQRRLTLKTTAHLNLEAWVSPTQDFAIGRSLWLHLPPE
ncbi:MAG: ABC transporter ATP-binding protein, partial [Coleofasciculaceae cyanobacterium SM2_1_6]|nr:ABC transporter ATP-binding protein [Coleofasciculaceae cyanobacterium SM2_1_6]